MSNYPFRLFCFAYLLVINKHFQACIELKTRPKFCPGLLLKTLRFLYVQKMYRLFSKLVCLSRPVSDWQQDRHYLTLWYVHFPYITNIPCFIVQPLLAEVCPRQNVKNIFRVIQKCPKCQPGDSEMPDVSPEIIMKWQKHFRLDFKGARLKHRVYLTEPAQVESFGRKF